MEKQRILVWLSGGVDSAVSTYLLKEQWHDVTAGFMINYLAPEGEVCPTKEDMAVAKEVAEFLEIPFFTFDYRDEYENKVLEYMYEWYRNGITPNPDIMCNSEIKFKVFQDEALELGFDVVATGHYARIDSLSSWTNVKDPAWGLDSSAKASEWQQRYKLLKWIDETKDQSYFLAGLSQRQLSKALFPIWHLEKSEVRKIAQKVGLPNADRKDSQGICFVGKVDIKDFLQKKIPHSEGDIVDTNWNSLWKHKWVFYYTIGQRKGIDIWWQKEAIFVIKKDIKNNRLIMGTSMDQELYSDSLYVSKIHFLTSPPTPLLKGEGRYKTKAKIRYRQADQECEVFFHPVQSSPDSGEVKEQWYEVVFTTPQRAIAAGQIIAFYDGEELWGSGVIS